MKYGMKPITMFNIWEFLKATGGDNALCFSENRPFKFQEINRDLISRVLSVNASQVGQGISGVE